MKDGKEILTIMDFSGVYEEERFYNKEWIRWIDCRGLEGTFGYCDPQAAKWLTRALETLSPRGLHFIDSGNFHYVTYFWIQKIARPFDLVVMDHHSDTKPPAFGNLLSCGSWVLEALEEDRQLKHVYLIGVDPAYKGMIPAKYKARITCRTREKKDRGPMVFGSRPVYVSIDKDVIRENIVETDWDQGDMTFRELKNTIRWIMASCEVIGMDICGENCMGPVTEASIRDNDWINGELLNLVKRLDGPNSSYKAS